MTHSIGIDVGKDEMVVCIRRSDGVAEPTISFPNTTLGVRRFLGKLAARELAKDTPILMESTGAYHWKAARLMADEAWNVRVVNPLEAKQVMRMSVRKRKTDPVDAGQLAFLAQQGYGYLFTETEEVATGKALVRHYWKLKDLARISEAHEEYLRTQRGVRTASVTQLFLRRTKGLETEIVKRFSRGNDLRYLDSIPGVSPLLAACILAELRPLSRFTRIEQVVAYAGLDPSVHQSGKAPVRYGRLSKRGSPVLRRTLFLAAFGAFHRGPLKSEYDRYRARGLHHKAALCILGRKILRIAFTLLNRREVFDASHVTPREVPKVPMSTR
jgi:transposase